MSLALASTYALSGCAASQVAIAKRDLDVQTRMSATIFLDPVRASERNVFVQIRNTSDQQDMNPAGEVASKGYRVVDDPDQARYFLQWRLPTTAAMSTPAQAPRPFTASDKSLISKVHGYMPAAQLLRMLNERMWADIGSEAPPYSTQQLQLAIQALQPGQALAGWSSVRRQLAEARRAGVLQQVKEQLIDDFAIVYSLSAKQVLHLKDVLISGSPQ